MKKLILFLLLTMVVYPQSSILLLMGDEGYTPVNFEVEIYIDTLTTTVSDGQIEVIDNLVTMLKDSLSVDSLSERFDVLYLLANETSEIALRNLVKTTHLATGVNSPTFTAFEGFGGDTNTVRYINTNYNESTQGVNNILNSSSYGVYVRNNTALNATEIGASVSTTVSRVQVRGTSNAVIFGLHQTANAGNTSADSRGLTIATRTANNAISFYKNGTLVETEADLSVAVVNGNVFILAENDDGTAVLLSNKQISIAFIGKGLDATEVSKITNCFEVYMDALGKGVIP